MPNDQPSRSQPSQVSSLAATSPRRRSPLRALLRLIVLLLFLISAAYLALLAWNAVQYFQTFPSRLMDPGLLRFMLRLPGLDLSFQVELVVALAMLVLFIGSLTLLLATRPHRGVTSGPAPSNATGATLPAGPEAPANHAPSPAEHHGLPLLPHMLIPTLPPEEAALLVPPVDTLPDAPDGNAPDGSSDGSL